MPVIQPRQPIIGRVVGSTPPIASSPPPRGGIVCEIALALGYGAGVVMASSGAPYPSAAAPQPPRPAAIVAVEERPLERGSVIASRSFPSSQPPRPGTVSQAEDRPLESGSVIALWINRFAVFPSPPRPGTIASAEERSFEPGKAIVLGGLATAGATVIPPVYVDPTQAQVLSEDTGPGDVDPTRAEVIS